MSSPSQRASAEGVLLAAAAGDALGWPNELRGGIVGGRKTRESLKPQARFTSWERTAGYRYSRYRDVVGAGEYSDDTQLLLCVARACLTRDWVTALSSTELPAWTFYERGGGRAVLAAASSWRDGRPPWLGDGRRQDAVKKYREAGGNGAAMRVAPHAIYVGTSEELLYSRVIADSALTHGHPRAILGALMYAAALWGALNAQGTLKYGELVEASENGLIRAENALGELPKNFFSDDQDAQAYAATWDVTVDECRDLLKLVREALGRGAISTVERTIEELGAHGPTGGAGTVTAAASIYLASRSAARPMAGLVAASFLREADTDTLASMTGGLLGAIHGPGWLNELSMVQDADYLQKMGSYLAGGSDQWQIIGYGTRKPIARRIREVRHALFDDGLTTGTFVDGRGFTVTERLNLSGGSKTRRARLVLSDGQTCVVDNADPPRRQETAARGVEEKLPVSLADKAETLTSGGFVSLPTLNLHRAIEYYSRLSGRRVQKSDDSAQVLDWLVLVEVSKTTSAAIDAPLAITVAVENIDEIAAAMSLTKEYDNAGRPFLRDVDPDGRAVRVEQRSSTPTPARS